MIRCYTELSKLKTFDERFRYLLLGGKVGEDTFGAERYFNQVFYRSSEWKSIRQKVIIRDNGCDMGLEDYGIGSTVYIHHMNPITMEDIERRSEFLLDPEFLVCVSFDTHNAIHYGNDQYLLNNTLVERRPNDQCPWKR